MKNPALTLLLVAIAAPAGATNDQLETVLVRAARQPIPLSALGSSVTVLDSVELEHRQSVPLAEVLRSVPGVAVSRAGVTGSQTQIRIRGGEANHVLVFIDGIRANDPAQNGEFNMSHVLNQDIESVEVIRGPQSALWGSDALSGVINITTRQAEAGSSRAGAFAEGGSNGWQNIGASGAYADGGWRSSASISSTETDGENISRHGTEDDGYDNLSTNLGLGYRFTDDLSVNSNLRYTDARSEFDSIDFGTGLPADSANRTDVDHLYGRVVAQLDTLDKRWSHQLSYAVTDTNNKNRDENTFAPTGFDVTESDADLWVGGYQTTFRINQGHSITGGYERQQEDFRQRGPVGYGDPNRDESMSSDSLILEYRGQLVDNVSVLASARHDDNSDFDDKTTGRLSTAWLINEGGTKLRAAYGTGIKNPTFTERYGYFNDFIGNPDLKPEQSTGWEAGIDQRLLGNQLNLSLTWFQESLDDEINGFTYDPNTGGYTAANDKGSSERSGIEFSGAWLLTHSLTVNLSYTWLDATEDDGASGINSDEIRRPEHIASANLNWNFLEERGNINVNLDYNGSQDDIFFPPLPPYEERVKLDSFTLVTVAASYRLTENLQIYARVENALDENYEEVFGFSTPGRSGVAGLRYALSD